MKYKEQTKISSEEKSAQNYIKKVKFNVQILLFLIVFIIFFNNNIFAVPAYPNPICYSQPNGDTLTIKLKGDERIHWYESIDGYTLLKNQAGYLTYAELDIYGNLEASKFIATNINERSFSVNLFLNTIEKKLFYSENQKNILLQVWEIENDVIKNIKENETNQSKATALIGTYKILCALVEFQNKTFTKTKIEFDNLMNQLGYSIGGASGSVRDYFREVSYGLFDVNITVCGIYTAPQNESYYVSNTSVLARWAAEQIAAEPEIDFSDYDTNGDAIVDGFHIIFAGQGQESTGDTETIWSHKSMFSPNVIQNGKSLNVYSCSPELRAANAINVIGTICHEMGHVFGAPDFYDTNYETGGEFDGTGNWDIMASGTWNGNPKGSKPAHHNMYTKSILFGWVNPIVLSTPQTITNMPNSAENTVAYRINTSTNNEYYLLENRQKIGFDATIPGSGLLIYHVHSGVNSGAVNATHPQKMYPVCAERNFTTMPNSVSSYGEINSAGCTFPGTTNQTIFTYNSAPPMKSWVGANFNKPITNITQNSNKTISFDFMDNNAPTIPINDICSNATNLTCGTLTQGTIANATATSGYSTASSNKDVFYKFTATNNGTYTITLNNFTNNKDLYLYQDCGTTTALKSSKGLSAPTETIKYYCTAGTKYIIRVVEVGNSTSGTFDIKFDCPQEVFVTPIAGSGGSISPNIVQNIYQGNNLIFTVEPDSCHTIDKWTVNGIVKQIGGTSYSLSDIQSNTTLEVSFKAITYDITPSSENGGKILPDTIQSVDCGTNITFNFTADAGYKINQVLIDGIENPNAKQNGNYTFFNVDKAHIINVKFSKTTAINNIDIKQFEIYPNPVKDEIIIKSELQIQKIEIYNLTGSLVLIEDNVSEKISVSALKQGIYTINIYTKNGMAIEKFVIKR